MTNYKLLNNLLGWLMFLVALFVYISTMESSVSFWDCGEFIPGALKLQVVHPPGAPLFLMIGRIFTMFATSPQAVPLTINALSAICTAFVTLFIFWTITAIARKIVDPKRENSIESLIVIMGSAIVGSLTCTFLDSMWFSAVEGEVYAMSMFFTALIVWAIFKWEEVSNDPHADRWLVFIAYVCGLSIGVHLLNLVAIPFIVILYFLKRFQYSRKNLIYALGIAMLILGVIVFGIIPYSVWTMAKVEYLLVNGFKMPFHSGVIVVLAMIIGAVIAGFLYAKKKNSAILHNCMLGLTFILIGYSSYAMVIIRSNANPVIDMNDPQNAFSLLSYLNREQYGDRPLVYGQYFDAKVTDYVITGDQYAANEKTGEYEKVGEKINYDYEPGRQTIFPRIYSAEEGNHEKRYRDFLGLKDKERPNFSDNLSFFLRYQFGWMYWRYLMWNFVGRQNDIQGYGQDPTKGNWISGIEGIDSYRLGIDQSNLPGSVKNNKAMNTYYFIPFLLGLFGLFYHYQSNKREWFAVFILFLFTGLMLVLYFNSPPIEPRERDYTMVGSFFVFCIWVGLAVASIYDLLKHKISPKLAAIVSVLICLSAPILMGTQNWDDHNRSERFTAVDFASNYLNSCAPNAILFTQGDNDTYPLWYAQEVEGIRTDVRVVNLSLLAVDWYINQLRRKINEAPAIKLSISANKILGDRRNFTTYSEDASIDPEKYYEVSEIVNFISSEDQRTKRQRQDGQSVNFLPTKKMQLIVNKEKLIATGAGVEAAQIKDVIKWDLPKSSLIKDEMMILDIIASNNWERPIYWAVSVDNRKFLGLDNYLAMEGLTYRLMPLNDSIKDQAGDIINYNVCADNLLNKIKFGGAEKKEMYLDENILRMFYNLRSIYSRVADLMYRKGNNAKAEELLDKSMLNIPDNNVPYNYFVMSNVQLYYKMGKADKGRPYALRLVDIMNEDLNYYKTMPTRLQKSFEREIATSQYVLEELAKLAKSSNDTELTNKLENSKK